MANEIDFSNITSLFTPSTTPAPQTQPQAPSNNSTGLWGSVVNGVVDLAGDFNYKAQANELAIAQANAEAAKANAGLAPENTKKNIIWIVVVIAVVVVVLLLITKKSD